MFHAFKPTLFLRVAGIALLCFVGRSWADGQTIGAPAARFELYTLEGEPLVLDKFRGRPLILNFFASWCDPCREEMPLINALAGKANENGYAVLGVAVHDRRASVVEFAQASKVVFPLALDLDSKVQRAYRVLGPPATFFVDGAGVLRDVVLGPLTAERAREAFKRAGLRQEVVP